VVKIMTDTNVLPLQKEIIYGPVLSRRLGRSLGINILSPYRKICTFDCVYCHYGRTGLLTSQRDGSWFYSIAEVVKATERALSLVRHLNAITFSGNGEPTLHPEFKEMVIGVKRLRDRLQPHVKLVLFSNSSQLQRHEVQEVLDLIDLPIVKLDTGDPELFEHINQPVKGISFGHILAGLQASRHFVLQTVLIDGKRSNSTASALERWQQLIVTIKPTRVQIYTTDRTIPEKGVMAVSPLRLKKIAEETQSRTGIPVDAYWAG
jgi:wyosine [tRNA(Phe)-imidazoG37] synthetase (radical SAM superfamily)